MSSSNRKPSLVHIRRDGLLMRIFPLDNTLEQSLRTMLTYTRSQFLATEWERRQAGGRHMRFYKIACYKILKLDDGSRQLVTNSGYLRRVVAHLRKLGYLWEIKDLKPLGRKGAFVVKTSVLDDIDFRPRQKDILSRMLTTNRGQVHYPTGAGKSFLARVVCQALPHARIIFTTKHQAVLKEVYNSLRQHVRSVGIYCSASKQNIGARVMCCSSGSLHNALEWQPDLIIGDETQELATGHLLEKLSKFHYCRFIGLSANYRDRMDGVDFELEGLFGPVIGRLTYQDAVQAGLVVPIRVYWRHVHMADPVGESRHRIIVQRYCFWRNAYRNRQIAQDARLFADQQVLIVVKTVEHALHLGRLLPEFQLCYAPMSRQNAQKFISAGLLSRDSPLMTKERLDSLKRGFEAGTTRKVIATSVWNRGVNFHNLNVLIRAGGGASRLDDTQIPGRLSRLGKSYGVLIDYFDDFHEGANRDAWSRFREYRKKEWQQIDTEDQPLTTAFSPDLPATVADQNVDSSCRPRRLSPPASRRA